MMLDLLIKNGTVFDGRRENPPQAVCVGVREGKIEYVGKALRPAKQVLDAHGLYVSPGFIDVQNHADTFWALFDYPQQESMLLQGITTIAVGHSGASLAPLPTKEALKSTQKWHALAGVNFNWLYFDEFLEELSRHELGVNVASLVGHSTIKRGLIGDAVRLVTEQELKVLERLLISSLKSGAWGLSFGLTYAHECNSAWEELLRLARIIGKTGRLLSVQLRNYGSGILESLDEVIEIAKHASARLKISHVKIEGSQNWGLFDEVIDRIERAHAAGLAISFDVYPYESTWSVLYTYLPKWAYEGGRVGLLSRLEQPFLRQRVINALRERQDSLGQLILAHTSSAHAVGKDISRIARDQGTDPAEALVNILRSSNSDVIVFDNNLSNEQVNALLYHPLSVISTDGAGFPKDIGKISTNLVHPRCFGTMPNFLARALQDKQISPSEAIAKITSLPASLLGLYDRGVIARHNKADLTVFNPSLLRDTASLVAPAMSPSGIQYVIVNGKLTVTDAGLTDTYAGQVLAAT